MSRLNKLTALAAVVALSGGLAACGGGSSTTTMPVDPDPTPTPTPQEQCEDAGGRWNADMTCTSAADLAAEEAARVAAETKAAGTMETAIAAELAQMMPDEPGLGGSKTPGLGGSTAKIGVASGDYGLEVANDRAVTITVHGATDDDDVMFMQAMDLGDGTTRHTRTMDADDDGNVVQEVVVVTTDRAAPMPVAFVKYEDATGAMSQELDRTETGDDTASDDDPFVAFGVPQDQFTLVSSSGFSSSGAGKQTYARDDNSTADMDEAYTTMGTYNGARGTYRCAGDVDCEVTFDGKGMITSMGADWMFTPDEGATSSQQDNDYLYYGFWLKTTTDADGAITYGEVQTFAMAVGPGHTASTGAIKGSASYTGGATGVYVHHVYTTGGGSLESSASGHFTADAALTATFGQADDDSIPPNMLNKLTGTIDNFMLSGGEMNDWSVALAGTVGNDGAVTAGTAKGGMGDGKLDVSFHGVMDMLPVAAVGEFNAGFSNGSVAGAFGVNRDEE